MTAKALTPGMQAFDQAVSAEVRALIARRNLRQEDLYPQLGVEQSWFSRRYTGRTPWEPAALVMVMNILDEDITKVIAAGVAAMGTDTGKTNPCLSDSAILGSERLSGWALRGMQLARKLYPSVTVDSDVKVA